MPRINLSSILSSDTLLICALLLAITLVSFKLLPLYSIPKRNDAALATSTAVTAYKSYQKVSKSAARKMRTTFHSGLQKSGRTKLIAGQIGYAKKLERLERAIEVNALVSGAIFRFATANEASLNGNGESAGWVTEDAHVGVEDHAKVREALNHFVRDWSEEGRRERGQAFGLVLDALKRLESEVGRRGEKRVLVPGAGLGRLAWEISQLGSFPHCRCSQSGRH